MTKSSGKSLIRDFTEGSIPKHLFSFMLPFMASNLFQVLYSTIDMIIVGQFVGTGGLSAVSVCGQMLNLCTMVCTGICTGGQILISQMIGAKRKKELNEIIGTLFALIFVIGLAVAAFIFLLRRSICTLLKMPPESFDMAVSYLEVCGIGLVFSFGYNMVSAVLRGLGDSKRPFIFVTIASVLNLLLDLLFTGYMGLGVAGAAAATMIGQAVSFILALVYLYRHRDGFGFEFQVLDIKLHPEYVRPILAQGLPLATSSGMIYFSMFYVNSLINSTGVVASATFGVGIKIDDLCNKVTMGIRYAAAPMIGQNYAAKKINRTKQIVYWSWIYGAVFHLCFMAVYLTFGRQLFMLFTSDPAILDLAPVFIHNIIWTFIPTSLLRGSNGFVQGIGNARLSMCFSIIDGVLCRICLSYLFGIILDMGFAGFVLGYGLAPFGAAIPGSLYFISGIWQKRQSLIEQIDSKKKVAGSVG